MELVRNHQIKPERNYGKISLYCKEETSSLDIGRNGDVRYEAEKSSNKRT